MFSDEELLPWVKEYVWFDPYTKDYGYGPYVVESFSGLGADTTGPTTDKLQSFLDKIGASGPLKQWAIEQLDRGLPPQQVAAQVQTQQRQPVVPIWKQPWVWMLGVGIVGIGAVFLVRRN